MSNVALSCPCCHAPVQLAAAPPAGTPVQCPHCGAKFPAPAMYGGPGGGYGNGYGPAPSQASYTGSYGPSAPVGAYGPSAPAYGPSASGSKRGLVIGISVAAAMLLGLVVVCGGFAAFWISSRQAGTSGKRGDAIAAAGGDETGGSNGANELDPALMGMMGLTPQAGQSSELPPLAKGVAEAMKQEEPKLKYNWKVGEEFGCFFTIKFKAGSQDQIITGLTSYQASNADPAAINIPQEAKEGEGTGTAFVVHPQGVLATCAHVVEGASEVQVVTDGKSLPARVIALDARKDLALLRIDATQLRYLPLADSDAVQLAQQIRVVGYPLSDVLGESIKVTAGEVSGTIERKGNKLLQIDATVNPGNSGGPVVDGQGRVVGVASNLLAGADIASMGFAVPANEVRKLLEKNEVPFSQTGADQPLAGPELAGRVTPAVMLVKVKFGRGGVGTTNQTVLDYKGQFQSRSSGSTTLSPSSSSSDRGRMLINHFGELAYHSGKVSLPMMMGQLGTVGIELLPRDDSRTWQAMRVTMVTRVKKSPSSRSPYPGIAPRYSPYGRRYSPPRPSLPRPSPGTLQLYPAIEQIDYTLGAESGDNVEIKKSYHLTSMHEKGEPTFLDIQGEGTILFDKVLGMPRKMDYEGTVSVTESQVTLKVPFTMEYHFEDPAQFAKSMADEQAKRQAALETSRQQAQVQPRPPAQPRPPVRRVGQPPVSRIPPMNSTGLDKFNPND